jgi:hypothetical protein
MKGEKAADAGRRARCKGCRQARELVTAELCQECADLLYIALWLDAFGYTSNPL